MPLRAFFDESGTWGDPNVEVVAIGGCIAHDSGWGRFETDWNQILSEYGVSRLHMRELSFFRGQFQGWFREKREQFLRALLNLLRRDVTAFLGATIAIRDFEALTPEQKARLHDPYFACFQACVHDAAAQTVVEQEEHPVELIFDNHPEFRSLVCDLYERYKQEQKYSSQLGSIVFASSIETPQLQAADLMAYELRLFWQDCCRNGKVEQPRRYLMQELLDMAPKRTFFHLFGPEALAHWLRPSLT